MPYTVEPLNNGHVVGTRHSVLYREVVLSLEVTEYKKNIWDLKM